MNWQYNLVLEELRLHVILPYLKTEEFWNMLEKIKTDIGN